MRYLWHYLQLSHGRAAWGCRLFLQRIIYRKNLLFTTFSDNEESTDGIVVIQNGEVFEIDMDMTDTVWHSELGEMDVAICREVPESSEVTYKIKVGFSEYAPVSQGVNIVICDTFLGEVVDAVGFDAMADWEIKRNPVSRTNPYAIW